MNLLWIQWVYLNFHSYVRLLVFPWLHSHDNGANCYVEPWKGCVCWGCVHMGIFKNQSLNGPYSKEGKIIIIDSFAAIDGVINWLQKKENCFKLFSQKKKKRFYTCVSVICIHATEIHKNMFLFELTFQNAYMVQNLWELIFWYTSPTTSINWS